MDSVLEIVSIILAVASTTLAITAFVFSWVFFRETSKAQRDIHTVLAKVNEKVDVVSERTARQMDKTWELLGKFAAPPLPSEDKPPFIEERSEHAIKSTAAEILAEVKASMALGDTVNADEALVETIGKKLRETSTEGTVLGHMQSLALDIDHIESLFRQLLRRFHAPVPRDASFADLLDTGAYMLSVKVFDSIRDLLDFRNRMAHDTSLRASDFLEQLSLAAQIINYFISYLLDAGPEE